MAKRIVSTFCYVLYNYFARYLPKSNAKISLCSKQIRRGLAKGFCSKIGKNVNIERNAIFSKNIHLGDNSGIGIECVLQGSIYIGKDVMMGPQVWIYTRNHRHNDIERPMIEQGFEEEKPVTIDDDVWIGSRVTILPGVHIGKGSIIGTGSVVTKDVPDYTIVAGNPAKVVKNRE